MESCGVGGRRGSDLVLLWLWRRLAATAPIQSLAWKPPYAAGAALKRQKRKKKRFIIKPLLYKCDFSDKAWSMASVISRSVIRLWPWAGHERQSVFLSMFSCVFPLREQPSVGNCSHMIISGTSDYIN